ncbi:hypothetical protein Ancab_004645 [Ancistrocladus abbreviatus]
MSIMARVENDIKVHVQEGGRDVLLGLVNKAESVFVKRSTLDILVTYEKCRCASLTRVTSWQAENQARWGSVTWTPQISLGARQRNQIDGSVRDSGEANDKCIPKTWFAGKESRDYSDNTLSQQPLEYRKYRYWSSD